MGTTGAMVATVGDDAERLAFGRAIQARRDSHNLTPGTLAERAGVTRKTIYNVEAGKSRPRTQRQVWDALLKWERDYLDDDAGVQDVHTDEGSGTVTFRVRGLGYEIEVEGPVSDPDALGRAVAQLVALLPREAGSL